MEQSNTHYVIGLMSGSSLDGIDLAYCKFTLVNQHQFEWELILGETMPIPESWKARLAHLPTQNAVTFARTHVYFGHFLAETVNSFIAKHQITALDFLSSHGHTIFHNPDKRYTTQIGCGSALAVLTGYPVVNDFRMQDIAINGEGTPIAPAADRYLFSEYDFCLNIGGIANITSLVHELPVAYDICPANQLLNFLARQLGVEFDAGGRLAASGGLLPDLLSALRDFPYYQSPYPKSISNEWIIEQVLPILDSFEASIEDKLHTATQFIAQEISNNIMLLAGQSSKSNFRLMAAGGGSKNDYLIQSIQSYLHKELNIDLIVPSTEIIDFKEAILMGLMGVLRVLNMPNCFSSVTGAKFDTIGGAIHQGPPSVVQQAGNKKRII